MKKGLKAWIRIWNVGEQLYVFGEHERDSGADCSVVDVKRDEKINSDILGKFEACSLS
jgi:hypothetical protein